MAIREPVVAGSFYPADAKSLRAFCLEHLPSFSEKKAAKAVMLPHAGYVYSGKTACEVLKRVFVPKQLLLIGPNHHGVGAGLGIWASGFWKTPLGRVPVSEELAGDLLSASSEIVADPLSHQFEHSLEVQIPFLQTLREDLSFVPLSVGTQDLGVIRRVASKIGPVLAEKSPELMILISSDMTHYESEKSAQQKDKRAIQAIEKLDAEALAKAVGELGITMCGFVPAYLVLCMAQTLGIRAAKLVEYCTSGDVSGDRNQVVGYAGIIFE